MIKRVLSLALLVLLVDLSRTAGVSAVPPLPFHVYGTVTVDGENLPEGTPVSASCSDQTYTTTTTLSGGQSVYALYVPGDDPESGELDGCVDGDTLSFVITFGEFGLPASQTAIWISGDDAVVNLTADLPTSVRTDSKSCTLEQNYPNPFNPTTIIPFSLPEKGRVSLRIYNAAGRHVLTAADREYEAGHHYYEWNGVDHRGRQVASGVYFYRLKADGIDSTRKMLLLK